MPFSIRLYRRFPVHCSVMYHGGLLPWTRHGLKPSAERMKTLGQFAVACWADMKRSHPQNSHQGCQR
jgi:hypothetical protein